MLTYNSMRSFTGKTESGYKFKTPQMKMRVIERVFPPPGLDLKIPADLTAEKFCKQIGGDCHEYYDKFENINEIFTLDSVYYIQFLLLIQKAMKHKGVPTH